MSKNLQSNDFFLKKVLTKEAGIPLSGLTLVLGNEEIFEVESELKVPLKVDHECLKVEGRDFIAVEIW